MVRSIEDVFEERARDGEGAFAVAFAILRLTDQTSRIASAVQALGLGNASTDMGAIELLSKQLRDTGERLSEAIERLQPD